MFFVAYIDVSRGDSSLVIILECNTERGGHPNPLPRASRSWFKDGQMVSSTLIGGSALIDESFLMAHPILNIEVFDTPPLTLVPYGDLIVYLGFRNVTSPFSGMLAPTTSIEQARDMVFDILLGNWTCLVNNSLGTSSIDYVVREKFNGKRIHPLE